MLKNKTKLNIFIFLLIILFISTGCVFNNGKKIKTSNNNQKVIQKNNKTNNKTKSPEQISSSTIKEDLNQKDNKQLAASTTETKDLDTSDWQTYRNEEYGFEIKYPKSWTCNSWFNSYTNANIGYICKNEAGKNIIYSIATRSNEELMGFVKKSGWIVGAEKLLPHSYNFNISDSKGIIIKQKNMIFLQHKNLILYIYGNYNIDNKIDSKIIKSINFD